MEPVLDFSGLGGLTPPPPLVPLNLEVCIDSLEKIVKILSQKFIADPQTMYCMEPDFNCRLRLSPNPSWYDQGEHPTTKTHSNIHTNWRQGRPARGGVGANASILGLGGFFFILGGIFFSPGDVCTV